MPRNFREGVYTVNSREQIRQRCITVHSKQKPQDVSSSRPNCLFANNSSGFGASKIENNGGVHPLWAILWQLIVAQDF